MAGRLDGRVALVTGAARGQGRAHSVALARAGASIIALDLADQIPGVPYQMATKGDLDETERLVRAEGVPCLAVRADVRDQQEVEDAVAAGRAEFGHVDTLVSNAGIVHWKSFLQLTDSDWHDVLEVNLLGAVNGIRAVLPGMVERGFGRIVCTGSTLGRTGGANLAGYSASKWALHGLVKSVAIEHAAHGVTANVVNPTIVRTPMMDNENAYRLFCPDIPEPTRDDALPRFQTLNQVPVPWIEPEDVAHAVLFLVSEDARFITGAALDVAAGANALYTA